jgi:hypothetical protein
METRVESIEDAWYLALYENWWKQYSKSTSIKEQEELSNAYLRKTNGNHYPRHLSQAMDSIDETYIKKMEDTNENRRR